MTASTSCFWRSETYGTPHDFSGSEVVAQIKETFAASTVVDSFGITKLSTTGHLKLALTSSQTEALGRLIASGYGERNAEYGIVQQAADPEDKSSPYLWDLKNCITFLKAAVLLL